MGGLFVIGFRPPPVYIPFHLYDTYCINPIFIGHQRYDVA